MNMANKVTAVYNVTDFAPYYYNVHILVDGIYAGVGKFCENWRELQEFCNKHNVETVTRRNFV